MANLYVFFDKRSPRKDGSCPLKMALSHKGETAYFPLDIALQPDEWDKEQEKVTQRPDKKFLNIEIRKRLIDSEVTLRRIQERRDYDVLTARQIMLMLGRGTDTVDYLESVDYVIPVYNEYIALAKKLSTKKVYRASLNNLIEYEKEIDSFRFKDINVAWLRKYQNWLTDKEKGNGMETNGANVYLRNLRTIFNYALKNEYTKARYPFRDIDMSTTEPDKRMIPYEKFLEWATVPLDSGREFYRDLFMLSFYLCGIRPVDLLHVKKEQVQEGRLVYWPEKLNGKTKLSIKIEPEAWEIIKKYEGKDYLINVMESRSDYKAFCKRWNMGVKVIGRDEIVDKFGNNGKHYNVVKYNPVVPYITIYYARTCFATYMYNIIDAPMDIISQAMGHSSGLKVTNFYVKRDVSKVDKANRDLIDKVTKDMKEFAERGV